MSSFPLSGSAADGTAVTSSYGRFGEKNADGSDKTYIISKRINPCDTDELVGFLK